MAVLSRVQPNDGFRASCARWIRDKARTYYQSNPDAANAARAYHASRHLADYIEHLALDDPRWRLLLRTSEDSDRFDGAGRAAKFVQFLGLNQPPPSDVDLCFSELCVEASAGMMHEGRLRTEVARARGEFEASRAKDEARITELEAQLAAEKRSTEKAAHERGVLNAELIATRKELAGALDDLNAEQERREATKKRVRRKKVAAA
jgi:hypothetical protein